MQERRGARYRRDGNRETCIQFLRNNQNVFEKATDYSVCTRHYRILKSQLGWLLYREEAEDIDNCFFFFIQV